MRDFKHYVLIGLFGVWKRFLLLGQHRKSAGMACKEAPDGRRLWAARVVLWILLSAPTWRFISPDPIFLDLDLGEPRHPRGFGWWENGAAVWMPGARWRHILKRSVVLFSMLSYLL